MGDDEYGINMTTISRYAKDIADAVNTGTELAIVVGGGNIFRGVKGAAAGMDRASADYMGMLATIMNALALGGALRQANVEAVVMSAIPMPTVCPAYNRGEALEHLSRGRVVIFAGGTGNPFFTTDTAATLRAIEMNCDCLAKATQVDGVYTSDPLKNKDAKRFDELSYDKILGDNLQIMDGTAIALARDNKLPMVIFSIHEPNNLVKMIKGEAIATYVTPNDE